MGPGMSERVEAAIDAALEVRRQPHDTTAGRHYQEMSAALAAADAVIEAWIDETVIVNNDGAWLDADALREIIKGPGMSDLADAPAAVTEALEQKVATLLYENREYTWQIQARRVIEFLRKA